MIKTIVRIENSLVELTGTGWKTDDALLANFCSYAETCRGLPAWDLNHNKAMAEQLLEACREENLDAEIISITPFKRKFSTEPGVRD